MGAVRQQDGAQLLSGLGAVDPAFEALFDQLGQQSAVVHMGVGQDYRLNIGRIEHEVFFIKGFHQFGTLEHTAVQQYLPAADFYHIAGTGYCARRA